MKIDQSLIGFQFDPYEVEVEAGAIRKFAQAIGDDNPIYHDKLAAKAKGYGAIVAPFTFPISFRAEKQQEWFMNLGPERLLHGEVEYHYNKRIVAGQKIHCIERVVDVYTKKGGSGELTFLVWEKSGYDENEELIFVEKSTGVILGAAE